MCWRRRRNEKAAHKGPLFICCERNGAPGRTRTSNPQIRSTLRNRYECPLFAPSELFQALQGTLPVTAIPSTMLNDKVSPTTAPGEERGKLCRPPFGADPEGREEVEDFGASHRHALAAGSLPGRGDIDRTLAKFGKHCRDLGQPCRSRTRHRCRQSTSPRDKRSSQAVCNRGATAAGFDRREIHRECPPRRCKGSPQFPQEKAA